MAIGHLPRRPGAYPGMALPDAFDFTGYLKEIGQDARYQAGRDLYTETEALITLEAETVAQKSPGEENRGESASSQPKVERFPVLAGCGSTPWETSESMCCWRGDRVPGNPPR
ncbi:MAG: hypothetical protein HC922_02755 [Leptolyngbyaceae cyanobacterium SM2_3_12]|nr:hypothetical protein [Leptolyngbyaceae cyanobacterium SM2_3_12]